MNKRGTGENNGAAWRFACSDARYYHSDSDDLYHRRSDETTKSLDQVSALLIA